MNDEFNQWLDKLETFCAYQERTTLDVVNKLKKQHIPEELHEKIINHLKEQGFLNEKRYITNFINSKINIKRDGIQKIKFALYKKIRDEKLIDEVLKEYDNANYIPNIQHLLKKKWEILILKNEPKHAKDKLTRYLLSKGYTYRDFKDEISNL